MLSISHISEMNLPDLFVGLGPKRFPGESYENYKIRVAYSNQREKEYLRGETIWNPRKFVRVPTQEGWKYMKLGSYRKPREAAA